MGLTENVEKAGARNDFTNRVLEDLRALEVMLDRGSFETGVVRLGAEQEIFLLDREMRPALVGPEVLELVDDPHVTGELAQFNLEINLDPVVVAGDAFRRFEMQAVDLLEKTRRAAGQLDSIVLLCGILPTLEKDDLTLEAMTPLSRYRALEEAMSRLRGGKDVSLRIQGRDELALTHDNMMMEACNTSFQVHRQVDPAGFARFYNMAQLLSAPLLASAANSPLLFGKVLWRETRIALFRQAVDTRDPSNHLREERARVTFGDRWVDDSILEIFRDDVSRFRVVLARRLEGDAMGDLEGGRLPRLEALALHNTTVYRWNRPCFGVRDGVAHLRIENRVLPSGPTVIDEIANAALWLGAMEALSGVVGDVRRRISFEAVRENFFSAARSGLDAQLVWLDGRRVPARELVRRDLVPAAREALRSLGVDSRDVDRLLWVVWERVRQRRTGAQWLVEGFDSMASASPGERCAALTAELVERQRTGSPIVEWPRVGPRLPPASRDSRAVVRRVMRSDLFTIAPDDVVGLAAALMEWRHIRHVPVEDADRRLVGLVTHRGVMRWLLRSRHRAPSSAPVREVMEQDVVTVEPSTPTLDAISLIRERGIGCLPVVEEGRLVGLVTERDLFEVADDMLRARLSEGRDGGEPWSSRPKGTDDVSRRGAESFSTEFS